MKQIKIIIEKTKNHYSAYAQNVDGIFGAGNTPDEAKQSIVKAIALSKKYNKPNNIPAILNSSYQLAFHIKKYHQSK